MEYNFRMPELMSTEACPLGNWIMPLVNQLPKFELHIPLGALGEERSGWFV